MRNNLFICFLFTLTMAFSQSEREVINQIDSINSVALSHYKNNDIVQSFNYFNESIKLSDSINDSYGNAVANFTLGKIYNYMQEFDEAERCYTKMLKTSIEIDDNFLIASSYLSLGEMYINKKQGSAVITYFEKALEYALKKEVRDQNNLDKQQSLLFEIRMNLSIVYLDNNLPSEALIYLLRAENNLDNSVRNLYSKAYLNYTYGLYFMNKESYNEANNKFRIASVYLEKNTRSEDLNNHLLLSKIYKKSSIALAKLDNNDEAYAALLKHNNSREKFINEEKVKLDNITKSKLFLAEYKQAAQAANKERILQQEVTNKIKNINLIITVTVFLLFISLLTLYKNYAAKRKLSNILEARNKQLEFAKDVAEKSSKLKTKFISNVTHELRTPLYGVVGLTSLLLKSNDLSEADNKFLKSLKYSGDYLLNLVNDILQIGKMESHKVELKNVSVNLKVLIENIIDSFEYRLQETNNKIQITLEDNIPQFIKCDNVRLSQILINLIGNSIKFTENGKIDVRVELVNMNNKDVHLKFVVEDNGPGIPKEKHQRIFENFSQLDENHNVNYQGTGLGLSIVKNLVELFNGNIKLESELGKGSAFSFDITFEIDNEAKIESTEKKTKGKTVPINGNYKILVAEDNKINQIVTQNVLQKGNFECEIVQNGLEALNAVKSKTYDLILMDINMPIMGGNEATKEIRKFDSNIPIVALTAADIEEVKKDFKSIGYNDIITKPFDNYEFYQTITTNIQQSKKSSFDGKLVKVS